VKYLFNDSIIDSAVVRQWPQNTAISTAADSVEDRVPTIFYNLYAGLPVVLKLEIVLKF